jgi:hypothetical protein
VKREPHRQWTDYDKDDIASWAMIRGLRAAAAERLRLKQLEASLLEAVRKINEQLKKRN